MSARDRGATPSQSIDDEMKARKVRDIKLSHAH
jgi:hypothetical protein